ncbi:MAG: thiamine pyrophosphate-binding protein [Gammaproteobacteria bacterium]|nr:thiamine pyrophosphate-binding protein [Gammaproteobacteria bacterium]
MQQGMLKNIPTSTLDLDIQTPCVDDTRQLADLFVDYLLQLGIDAVFGVPGGAIEPLYNALARSKRRSRIQAVVARHEAGAAFMAMGYAKETGKIGVCCTTTGPGATNVLTAVASAYWDELPLLVITGQTPVANSARGALQDSSSSGINTVGLFQYCTRFSRQVDHPLQFERLFVQALQSMHGDPPGPAHLSVAPDIFRHNLNHTARYDALRFARRAHVIDIAQINALANELRDTRQAVILLGEVCAHGVREIVALAERLQIPFITTPGAKGLVATHHPLNYGVFGFAGHVTARELLLDPRVDLIVAVGTRLGEWDTLGWDEAALLNEKLVHVDQYSTHFAYSLMARMQVQGDIALIFGTLLNRFIEIDITAAVAGNRAQLNVVQSSAVQSADVKRDSDFAMSPVAVMTWLHHLLPEDACVYVDAGNSTCWGVHYLASFGQRKIVPTGGDWFRMSSQFASMGWAIGNAIGAAYANRNRVFVCVTGDGSWLMNGQEFTVAVAERIPMVFVILNDHAYGMVKHGQRMANAEPIAFALPEVDFSLMACAMGGKGIRVHSLQQLQDVLPTLKHLSGPLVLDIVIDGEVVPPMQARVKVLEAAQ